jgi:hypothetical protein
MENSYYPRVGEIWRIRTQVKTTSPINEYRVVRIFKIEEFVMVEGAVGDSLYQWPLDTVLKEDSPDEASIAKRIMESYEE